MWPMGPKTGPLREKCTESGVWNNQVCTLPFTWMRHVCPSPWCLPCASVPEHLQTCPKNCLAHWIIQCLHAMLPWGAPDVHAIAIIAAELTQKGWEFQTQLKEEKKKGYSVAIKRWSIPIFMVPALACSYWPDGPGVNVSLSNKIQKGSSCNCCCGWPSYRLFCSLCGESSLECSAETTVKMSTQDLQAIMPRFSTNPTSKSQITEPHFSCTVNSKETYGKFSLVLML